jgi:hypothetical protein
MELKPLKKILFYCPSSEPIAGMHRENPFKGLNDTTGMGLSTLSALLEDKYELDYFEGKVDLELPYERIGDASVIVALYPIYMGEVSQKSIQKAVFEDGKGVLFTAEMLNLEGNAHAINSFLQRALGGAVEVRKDRLTDPKHLAEIIVDYYGTPFPTKGKPGDVLLPLEWVLTHDLHKGLTTRSGASIDVDFDRLRQMGVHVGVIYKSGAEGWSDMNADGTIDAGEVVGNVIGGIALSNLGNNGRIIILGDTDIVTNRLMQQENNDNSEFILRAIKWLAKDYYVHRGATTPEGKEGEEQVKMPVLMPKKVKRSPAHLNDFLE